MIAIAGGKGGCGKTTTTLGVARALAARGVRARAADLDTGMPNLHRLAGVEREPTLADVVADPGRYQRDACGVEVLPAPRVTAPLAVDDALDVLGLGAAVTLLDCPAGAGPDAAAPIRAASAVVLVSTDRPESVEDAAKTGCMARSLDVPVLGAVVTRTDSLSACARETLPTDHVVAVPTAEEPLAARPVRDCYDVVARWLVGDGGEPTDRQTDAADANCSGSPDSDARRRRSTGPNRSAEPLSRSQPATRRSDAHAGRSDAAAGRAVAPARRSNTGAGRSDAAAVRSTLATARPEKSPDRPEKPSERSESVHGRSAPIDTEPHSEDRTRSATRRRGRRSRRSRAPVDTRSSSRGGGAPSDRR